MISRTSTAEDDQFSDRIQYAYDTYNRLEKELLYRGTYKNNPKLERKTLYKYQENDTILIGKTIFQTFNSITNKNQSNLFKTKKSPT